MGEAESDRLIAWNRELLAAHRRLRASWELARGALDELDDGGHVVGDLAAVRRDLLLYCKGFCAALDGHHKGESAALFPALLARVPELGPTIAKLQQDHDMIADLLLAFDRAVSARAEPSELAMHLDGLGAIMDSHFGYEERHLLFQSAQVNGEWVGR